MLFLKKYLNDLNIAFMCHFDKALKSDTLHCDLSCEIQYGVVCVGSHTDPFIHTRFLKRSLKRNSAAVVFVLLFEKALNL